MSVVGAGALVLSGGGSALTAIAAERGSAEPPDPGDGARLSVRLVRDGAAGRPSTPIRAGDVLHFRISLGGPARRARLAVAATPKDALSSLGCEDAADKPVKPAAHPRVCEFEDITGTKNVDVALRVPGEAEMVGVTAVAHMRDPAGVQWVRRMADVKFRIVKPSGPRGSVPELGEPEVESESRAKGAGPDPESRGDAPRPGFIEGSGPAGGPPVDGAAPKVPDIASPASAGPAAPEAAKSQAGKGEDPAGDAAKKAEAGRAEASNGDASKSEAAKGETLAGKAEAGKVEASKVETPKGDAAKGDAGKAEAAKGEISKAEAAKGDAGKAEAAKGEISKAEAAKGDVDKNWGAGYFAAPGLVDLLSEPAGSVESPETAAKNVPDKTDKTPKSTVKRLEAPENSVSPDEASQPTEARGPADASARRPERFVALTALPPQVTGGLKAHSGPGAAPALAQPFIGATRTPAKAKASPPIPHPAPGIPARPAAPARVANALPAPMPVQIPVAAPVPALGQAPAVAPLGATGIQMPQAGTVPPIMPAQAAVPAPMPVQTPAAAAGQAPVPGPAVQGFPGAAPAPALGAPLPQEIRPAKRDLTADTEEGDLEMVRGLPAAVAAVVLLLAALALQLKLRRRWASRK
ncbi:hypothetical protein GCM10022226_70780 [Sphaerisporangium flaviroseum]|uniref:Uncharacterized protein n=2 Tax=Sphaerisporangium flaviroseum TaxID=509199 RepID=A0ABP7J984_9ACTN